LIHIRDFEALDGTEEFQFFFLIRDTMLVLVKISEILVEHFSSFL